MTEAIIGLVLWAVIGGAVVVALYIVGIFGAGLAAINDKPGLAGLSFVGGIILALGTLCLVVINVINQIVQIVQIATNGG